MRIAKLFGNILIREKFSDFSAVSKPCFGEAFRGWGFNSNQKYNLINKISRESLLFPSNYKAIFGLLRILGWVTYFCGMLS
jgi:hypothetical protein